MIEIENPNRVVKKTAEKVSKIDLNAAGSSKPDLSRREREELEKQRAQANYQKLHAEGKTDQARADLARLAIIKQHRAEAAARREAEKKGKRQDPPTEPTISIEHSINTLYFFFPSRKRGKEYEKKWCKILVYGYSIAILNMIENVTLKESRLITATPSTPTSYLPLISE